MLLSEFFVRGSENYLSFFCVITRSTVLPNQYLSGSVFRDTLDSFKLVFKSAIYATTESIADPRAGACTPPTARRTSERVPF